MDTYYMVAKKYALGVILFAMASFLASAQATILVTDPDDVGNDINTLGVTMSEEVGNTSLTAFNALSLQRTFTIDSTATPSYPAEEVNGDSFVLTLGVSGVNKTLNMSHSGSGSFWLVNAAAAAFLSSGDQSLVRGGGSSGSPRTSTFTFDTAVQAFGFTANRLIGDGLTVNLYSDSGGSSLISTFAMSVNGSTDHSFFGYTSAAQNILRIDLVGSDTTSQYGVDDVSFSNTVAVPEPSTLVLFAGAVLALGLFRHNRKQ